MVRMENGLEDFYFRLEETDQWMDAAIERTQDLQGAQGSVEDQFNTFRVSFGDDDDDNDGLVPHLRLFFVVMMMVVVD